MKSVKLLLAALILLSNTAAVTALAADGIISKVEVAPGSYCHEKFPAIEETSLASNDPVLQSPASGDIIDFYGPCNENPVGKDQVQAQRLQAQHRWASDYTND